MKEWNLKKHIVLSVVITMLIFLASVIWFNYKNYGKISLMILTNNSDLATNVGIGMISVGCLFIFLILLAIYKVIKLLTK
ncbi:hypothetical protein CHF27_013055 [Romboutsia maritimum]|uniref:DUF3955 domain-containing protein n=1 Tax=Romboutsia maritimum TaxID=2020948 RepID=A0A371IPX0_9FIRM|nr:hypothetical protein [Romboutsia maritimum]RDY22513.1 hypothetical protein CHF27_013055 [Romboutsia maritimum]